MSLLQILGLAVAGVVLLLVLGTVVGRRLKTVQPRPPAARGEIDADLDAHLWRSE